MITFTYEQFLWIVLAVVPGLIAHRVYQLRCPNVQVETSKLIPELITYSLINLIFWFWLVIPIVQTPFKDWDHPSVALIGIWVCLLSPTIMALVWVWLRKSICHRRLGMDHPTPRGWDFFLENRREFLVLFHLKGGKKLGGYFGGKSYASKYPQEPEIFVQTVWHVDQDTGVFLQEVPGSAGAVLRQSDWDFIEFFVVERSEQNAGSQKGDVGQRPEADFGGDTGDVPTGAAGAIRVTAGPDYPTARRIGNESPTTTPI